jgi:hypothetical protein
MVAATWSIDPTEVNDMFKPPKFYKLQTPFSPQAQDRRLAHPASRRCRTRMRHSANAFASPVSRSEFRMHFNLTGAGFGDDLEGMIKVEYFNDIYTKYLGQYKSMNDAVAAYIIDHVDWTPAAEFLAHNDIHEAAVMNDLEQQDDPDDEALDTSTPRRPLSRSASRRVQNTRRRQPLRQRASWVSRARLTRCKAQAVSPSCMAHNLAKAATQGWQGKMLRLQGMRTSLPLKWSLQLRSSSETL